MNHYQDDFTKKEYVALSLHTFSDRVFEIRNIDFALSNKIRLMFAVEASVFGQPIDSDGDLRKKKGEKVFFKKLESGEFVQFSADKDDEAEKLSYRDVLSSCKIRVDNLTLSDFVDRTSKDIYYSLVSL